MAYIVRETGKLVSWCGTELSDEVQIGVQRLGEASVDVTAMVFGVRYAGKWYKHDRDCCILERETVN